MKEYGEVTTSITPADETLFNIRESPLLSAADAKRFQSFVAKLLYLSKRTGRHVPVIERKIRLVKERRRALFSKLPCALCKQLLIALVKFATPSPGSICFLRTVPGPLLTPGTASAPEKCSRASRQASLEYKRP